MFPQSSYNTPHGYQFGREQAAFTEETGINLDIFDEALSERAFEETNRPQDVPALDRERDTMLSSSRAEAQVIALPTERQSTHERDITDSRDLAYVGKLMRSMRDWEEAA